MLYKPSSLVTRENVTLVSTLVASTVTPATTAPDESVTRPVNVAVGPASSGDATRRLPNHITKTNPEHLICISLSLQNPFRRSCSVRPRTTAVNRRTKPSGSNLRMFHWGCHVPPRRAAHKRREYGNDWDCRRSGTTDPAASAGPYALQSHCCARTMNSTPTDVLGLPRNLQEPTTIQSR